MQAEESKQAQTTWVADLAKAAYTERMHKQPRALQSSTGTVLVHAGPAEFPLHLKPADQTLLTICANQHNGLCGKKTKAAV